MANRIIVEHNRIVRDEDIVYNLGDVGFYGAAKDVIPKLKGTNILIIGNHDRQGRESYFKMGFKAVLDQAVVTFGKHKFLLNHRSAGIGRSHVKMFMMYLKKRNQIGYALKRSIEEVRHCFKIPTGHYLIHGHTHSYQLIGGNKQINVCCEAVNYKPISINQIINLIKDEKK
jgi:calcineurin-like phosphoesterase family protein